MREIAEKIVSLLQSDATLQTLLAGTATDKRVYPDTVNKFETFPCVTYREEDGSENTVPRNTQVSLFELKSFSNVSLDQVDQINERVKAILKYYSSDTPIRFFWTKKELETDLEFDDRLLFCKILRYRIWTRKV